MIRAKFKCSEIIQRENASITYILNPVTVGEENKEWSKWTPSGKLEMVITNPEAKFEIGKEYYLDFTEVEK